MYRLLVLTPMVSMMIGCTSTIVQRQDRVAIAGFVRQAQDGSYVRFELKNTALDFTTLEDIVDPFVVKEAFLQNATRIESKDYLVLSVLDGANTQAWQEFTAYLGPAGPNQSGACEVGDGSVVVCLYYGWVYLTGRSPAISTERALMGSIGSKILVQIDGDVHRAFLLESGTGATVVESKITGQKLEPPLEPGYYVEVDDLGNLSAAKKIEDDATQKDFVELVLKIAGEIP